MKTEFLFFRDSDRVREQGHSLTGGVSRKIDYTVCPVATQDQQRTIRRTWPVEISARNLWSDWRLSKLMVVAGRVQPA
jgi:hypothetical protein